MLILGIETSCDETSASVVKDGTIILSNIISSQIDIHKQFGGVVPEVAARKHIEQILSVVKQALVVANVTLKEIDKIAVTMGPGLIGALLVGLSFAKGLSLTYDIPLVPIHHIAGHIAANYLCHADLKPPFLSLVVSGGHSHIIHVETETTFNIVGQTRDDAAGETFDKIARALNLGYPGGPIIEQLAKKGNKKAILFPMSNLSKQSNDYSFSGLKTSALNLINQFHQKGWPISIEDFVASYQEAIVSTLVYNVKNVLNEYPNEPIVLAGGVACNKALQENMKKMADHMNRLFYYPTPILCTDNAAMIASMGYYVDPCKLKTSEFDAVSSLRIDEWMNHILINEK